jgi:pyruvate/2-oxoglutarate dehydrogenase complex dihydrolipoamide acyltransferase (E2) component
MKERAHETAARRLPDGLVSEAAARAGAHTSFSPAHAHDAWLARSRCPRLALTGGDHKARTGESLSFTAFIITCVAHAVDENKAVQAMRRGRKRLALFDEVDVSTAIEREMAGQKQPIGYTIRAANTKTFREIHHEMRAAQVEAVEHTWEGFKGFTFLPLVVFRVVWPIFWWVLGRFPRVQKRYGATVGLTAVGMSGKGAGWGIPIANRTQITLGGIAQKPGVVDGQIAIRDYLSLTLSFNHELIDGAPATRFTQRLKDLIESGSGLPDSTEEREQAGAEAGAQKR